MRTSHPHPCTLPRFALFALALTLLACGGCSELSRVARPEAPGVARDGGLDAGPLPDTGTSGLPGCRSYAVSGRDFAVCDYDEMGNRVSAARAHEICSTRGSLLQLLRPTDVDVLEAIAAGGDPPGGSYWIDAEYSPDTTPARWETGGGARLSTSGCLSTLDAAPPIDYVCGYVTLNASCAADSDDCGSMKGFICEL